MRRRAGRGAVLAALILASAGWRVGAQGTAPVPPTDLVYRDVDRLADLGLLDSVVLGQRPYSRRELARIAAIASRRFASGAPLPADVAGIVARLVARFGGDSARAAAGAPTVALLDGASVEAASTDAVRRGFSAPIPDKIEATIDPLATPRRLGSPAPTGQTVGLELAQRSEPTSWLALHARERLDLDRRNGSFDRAHDELLLAGVRARFGNVAVSAGREQFAWATTSDEGLFIASDAPALDQVSVAGDRPFLLPGFLHAVGPTQATLIVADLGPSGTRSHSKLLAYKVSVQPTPTVELGASFLNHFGGRGGRASSFGNRLIDFLPFIDIFRSHNYTDTTRTLDVESDKLLGLDGRWRVAALGGLVLSGEMLIDDFDVRRLPTMFGWDGSQTVAAAVPSVGGTPLSLHFAATHMGVRTYAHATLTNGIATRGQLLGDELGPDAKSFDIALGWHGDGRMQLRVDGRTALYSFSDYTVVEQGGTLHLHRKGTVVNELRDRVLGTMELQAAPTAAVVLRAGAERIRNADFTAARRHSYVVDLSFHLAR